MCILAVVVVGLHDPLSVSRKVFYCVVDKTALTVFIGAYSALCCISACVFEGTLSSTIDFPPRVSHLTLVLIAINLRRNRSIMVGSGMDTSLILRVIAFGLTLLWGIVYEFPCSKCSIRLISFHSRLAGYTIYDWSSVVPDLCFATFGLIFFFTFASQRDVIRLWRRWSAPCISVMFTPETDVNLRALALVDSNYSFKTEPSSDRFVLTPREATVHTLK